MQRGHDKKTEFIPISDQPVRTGLKWKIKNKNVINYNNTLNQHTHTPLKHKSYIHSIDIQLVAS